MSRRTGTWLAIAALVQQLMLPGLALAHPAQGAGGMIEICTPAGIVRIPGDGVPTGRGDGKGSLSHGAQCHANRVCDACRQRRGRRLPRSLRGR